MCVDCGTNYSVDSPPRYDWTCDNCGGEVRQRDDDTEEAIRHRLDLYREQTEPLIAWYQGRDLLAAVDGLGHPDEVTRRLIRAVDAPHRAPSGGRRRLTGVLQETSDVGVRKPPEALKKMRAAGRVVAEMHAEIREAIRPGVTTAELDRVGRDVHRPAGRPLELPRLRHRLPGVICTSPNDVIVHGIPAP